MQRLERRRGARREIGAAVAALTALASCLGPTAGEVPLAGLDKPAEKNLAFAAGTELGFAVHVDKYQNSGQNHVLLDVTLLLKGAPVANMKCAGFELEGGAGCGSGATHSNSDCAMKVPAGGSDGIRVVATLQDKTNSASFEGLSVYLRK